MTGAKNADHGFYWRTPGLVAPEFRDQHCVVRGQAEQSFNPSADALALLFTSPDAGGEQVHQGREAGEREAGEPAPSPGEGCADSVDVSRGTEPSEAGSK
jgi:hypothetical protein